MRIGQELEQASRRSLLLDYDGTLREIVGHPDLATPTPEILELLTALAALPDTDVHVVSGRRRESLDAWLGRPADPPLRRARLLRPRPRRRLGDPGATSTSRGSRGSRRSCSGSRTTCRARSSSARPRASPGTTGRPSRTTAPGAPASSSWRSSTSLGGVAAEILPGRRVVEVRARGVNKGAYVERLLAAGHPEGHLAARRRRRRHRRRPLPGAARGRDRDPRRATRGPAARRASSTSTWSTRRARCARLCGASSPTSGACRCATRHRCQERARRRTPSPTARTV